MGYNQRLTSLLVMVLVAIILLASTPTSVSEIDYSAGINPPEVYFSISDQSVMHTYGDKFSIGLIVQGCSADCIILANLYSVSYNTSWESNTKTVYTWKEGAANGRNNLFFSIDLTNAPEGNQQITVTTDGGGQNYGGGPYIGPFYKTSKHTLNFTIDKTSSSPISTSAFWNTQTIDTRGASGGAAQDNLPVAIDSNNITHVAYSAFAVGSIINPIVMYASWTGKGWATQAVDEGWVQSFCLDTNNNPHITYVGWSGLSYASWTGADWAVQTIDKKTNLYGAIALDTLGTPHVAFSNGKWVKYASLTPIGWSTQTIDTWSADYDVPAKICLKINKADTVYILYGYQSSYYDASSGGNHSTQAIKVASYNGQNWNIQLLNLPQPINGYGNMVLDSHGYPHFICAQADSTSGNLYNRNLLYVNSNGNSWNIQTVANKVHLTMKNPLVNWLNIGSLALDKSDTPYVTYRTEEDALICAKFVDNNWSTQKIDIAGSAEPGNIVIDQNSGILITYLGPTNVKTGHGGMISIVNVTMVTLTDSDIVHKTPEFATSVTAVTAVVIAIIIAAVLLISRYYTKKGCLEVK